MKDYTGKTVFIGIDVHKKTYAVAAICDGVIVKRETLKANPQVLIDYLIKKFGSGTILTAYESGFCGFHLHRTLEAANIKNSVVHAAAIEISNDRVKTDKRDCLKIATHLSQNRLEGIHVPSIEREDCRTVTRLRDTFCRERTRIACQIKSLLFLHGFIQADDHKKTSLKWIKNLSTYDTTPGVKYALEHYADMWIAFDLKIKEIDKKLKEQAKEEKEIDGIYQSVPGIGPTSARILANELGDMQQFNNEGQLFSYLGFTPSEHSSGEHTRQGHITKQGKPILRKVLVQAAWVAIKHDKELKFIFERIASKAGKKRAIVAVARRLAGRMRSCFRTGALYETRQIELPEIESSKYIKQRVKEVA